MRLCVANHTKELHALKLAFSENEAFLFCGLKLFHFRLPPFFRHSFSVNLVPVRIGEVCLPTPKLFCVTTGEEVLDSAPRHRGTTPKGSPRGVRRPVGPLAFRGRTPRLRLALARWARCALGVPQYALGVDRFGESGTIADLHDLGPDRAGP